MATSRLPVPTPGPFKADVPFKLASTGAQPAAASREEALPQGTAVAGNLGLQQEQETPKGIGLQSDVALPTPAGPLSIPLPGESPFGEDLFLTNVDQVNMDGGELPAPVTPALTLEHLQHLAQTHHPAIAEAQARVSALRGKWLQVGLNPNPVAYYNIDEAGDVGSAGLHKFTIGQTYVTAGKLGLRRQVVAAEIQQAQADLATAQIQVRSDVQAVFQSALVAQERFDLSDQLRNIASKSIQSVDAMYAAQETSKIALLQAQTELQNAELVVETAQAKLRGARQRLAAVVAVGELPSGRLMGDIDHDLEPLDFESLRSETIASSPEISSRAAEIVRAQQALRLACATVTPDINGQLAVGVNTLSDDTFGSLQVSLPLPITNRNQGNIRRYRAEIMAADRALSNAELQLSWRLALAVQLYEVARLRQDRFRREIVPRAEETLTLSMQAFEAGESSFLELLTVQRTLFQARLSLLEATGLAIQSANQIDNYLIRGVGPGDSN